MWGYFLSFAAGFGGGWFSRGFYDDHRNAKLLGLATGSEFRAFEKAGFAARAQAAQSLGKENAAKLPVWALPGMAPNFPPQTQLPAVLTTTQAGPAFICASPDVLRYMVSSGKLNAAQLQAAGIPSAAPAPAPAMTPEITAPVASATPAVAASK